MFGRIRGEKMGIDVGCGIRVLDMNKRSKADVR